MKATFKVASIEVKRISVPVEIKNVEITIEYTPEEMIQYLKTLPEVVEQLAAMAVSN